jgi:hypothetical protein
MNHAGDILEEPIMWAVTKEKNVLWSIAVSQSTPTFGNERANTSSFYSSEDGFGKLVGFIYHDRAKANVYWRWACFQKLYEIFWRMVI